MSARGSALDAGLASGVSRGRRPEVGRHPLADARRGRRAGGARHGNGGRRRSARRRSAGRRAPAVGLPVVVLALAFGVAWPWALVAAVAAAVVVAAGTAVVAAAEPGRLHAATHRWISAGPGTGSGPAHSPGRTSDGVREVLAEADASIAGARAAAERVTNEDVRARALAWCGRAERLIAELRRRPKDVARARRFLTYYAAAARAIVAGYARLEEQGGGATRGTVGADADEALAYRRLLDRVGPALDDLDTVLREQSEALLRDDAFDLDVELSLLARTMRFDALPGAAAGAMAPQADPGPMSGSGDVSGTSGDEQGS